MRTLAQIIISDPWDWVAEHGSGPYRAIVLARSNDQVFVRCEEPIAYKDQRTNFLLGTIRSSIAPEGNITSTAPMPCDFIPVPQEVCAMDDPQDLMLAASTFGRSWSNGGFLGSITLSNQTK